MAVTTTGSFTATLNPRRVLLAGDTHADIWHVQKLFEVAEADADVIVQLGDFGFWEHTDAGVEYLDHVEELAASFEMGLLWLDGNHENHQWLRQQYQPARVPGCKRAGHEQDAPHEHLVNPDGTWPIRDHIAYLPRGHRWTWQGVRFLAVGGAYSIDKKWRVPGLSWWPEEELTDDDVRRACRGGRTDVLLTHDAPLGAIPPGMRSIRASDANRQRVRQIVDHTRPVVQFHGHFHAFYTDQVTHPGGTTRVVGLASNIEADRSWAWLDLPELTWTLP